MLYGFEGSSRFGSDSGCLVVVRVFCCASRVLLCDVFVACRVGCAPPCVCVLLPCRSLLFCCSPFFLCYAGYVFIVLFGDKDLLQKLQILGD